MSQRLKSNLSSPAAAGLLLIAPPLASGVLGCALADKVEAEIESFIIKFDGDAQRLIRNLRAALKSRIQDCAELVWNNYNFFVIGYPPTERPADHIVSIAASAGGVGLSFNNGARLADPDRILLGSSKVNRFMRLPSAKVLAEPKVEAMLRRAIEASSVWQPWSGGGKLIIR